MPGTNVSQETKLLCNGHVYIAKMICNFNSGKAMPILEVYKDDAAIGEELPCRRKPMILGNSLAQLNYGRQRTIIATAANYNQVRKTRIMLFCIG